MMEAFKKWVHSEQCSRALEAFAKRQTGRSKRGLSAAKVPEFYQDLPGKMWERLHLMANREELDDPVRKAIQGQQWDRLLGIVLDQVRRGSIDEERKYDPRRKLYKTAQEALSSAPPPIKTKTVKDKQGTLYSLETEAQDWPGLALEEFATPNPLVHVAHKDLYKADSLRKLARLFWDAVKKARKTPFWVPVRVFTTYLTCHYAVMVEFTEFEEHHLTVDVEHPQSAKELAESLVCGWNDKMRTAFVLHIEEDKILKDIAAVLGYASPSGVAALLDRIQDGMGDQMLREGLTFESFEKPLWDEVVYFMLELCKTPQSGRVSS